MSKIAKIIYATATLSGTIIGVGLFALPYITLQVGVWVMAGYFLVLAPLVILIHQFFGEVALNTKDFLRLPSYAEIYLGKWGKRVSLLTMLAGFIGAILAYIIVGGKFLSELLMPFLGGNDLLYTIVYFAAGALLTYVGIKAVAKIEFWGIVLFLAVLAAISWKALGFFDWNYVSLAANGTGNWFLPYGAVLFSLWGAALIPEAEEILGEDKKLLRRIIPAAILIAVLVYLFFIFLTLGVSGSKTSQEALVGLGEALGNGVVSVMLIFGILTTFTSFVALALTFKKVFWYDLKINETLSWAIACFTPFVLFLIGLQNFIGVIGFVGGVALAIEGVLIVLMYRKLVDDRGDGVICFRRFCFLTYPLIGILLLGIIYEIIYFWGG